MDLYSLRENYPTQKKRIKLLEELRWDGEPTCPKCGCTQVSTCSWRPGYWACRPCRREFTVLSGTVFQGTRMPLAKWFDVMMFMCNSKRGISAKDMSKHVRVMHCTAWFAMMRIRCAMVEWPFELSGIVEADEMYYGPKKHRKRTKNMLPQPEGTDISTLTSEQKWGKFPKGKGTIKKQVVGIVQRDGKIAARTFLEAHAKSKDMLELIHENVDVSDAILVTDSATEYNIMNKFMDHFVVNHKKKEYARDWIHTNTIEGFWANLKNSIRGAYIRVDDGYLPFYLSEFTYRYNRRGIHPDEMFWDLLQRCVFRTKCFVDYKPAGDPEEINYPKSEETNRIGCAVLVE